MERPDIDAGPGNESPQPPTAPPVGRPAVRQLRRRPDDGNLAGVCAGLAEYFNVDPVIVRIAAVVLLFSGPGAFAYVLAWIFVPAATDSELDANRGPIDRTDRRTQILGVVLLAIALSVIWGDWWSPRWFFPFGLISLGGWLLLRPGDDDKPALQSPASPTTRGTTDALVSEPPAAPVDVTAAGHRATTDSAGGGHASTPPWDVVPPIPPDAPEARPRRILAPIAFGALLIWLGAAWMFGVSVQSALAVGLGILGVGFVLGAFVGGSRALIVPALMVGLALAVTATIDVPLVGPIGEQRWTPASAADVQEHYESSVGKLVLDLSAVDVGEGGNLPIDVSVGIGHLVVYVPQRLALDVTTNVGVGESKVLGAPQGGVGISTSRYDQDGATGGTLELRLHVGLGQIEVIRLEPHSTSGLN